MSLAVAFSQLYLDDPIMRRLHEGSIEWGSVPFEEYELEFVPTGYERYVNDVRPVTPVKAEPIPVVEIPNTGIKTLMAKNLPRDITVEKLRSIFEVHGPIRDIYIPKNMDKSSPYFGTIKGFAKVQYLKPDDAAKAYQTELGRLNIGNNKIIIEFAKEDR